MTSIRLSDAACVIKNSKEIVEFPNQEMIDEYIKKEQEDLFISAIESNSSDQKGYCFNFIMNNQARSNFKDTVTYYEHSMP